VLEPLGRQSPSARQEDADQNRVTHAEWLEKIDLSPHEVTNADIYDAVDPNKGGLTGPQAANLVTRRAQNIALKASPEEKAAQKTVKESISSIKRQVKAMYDRGDFGEIHAGKDSAKKNLPAKVERANAILALEEWVQDNPDKDPTDWFESYLDRQAAERSAKALNDTWAFLPWNTDADKNARLKKIASGEMDESIARRLLVERKVALGSMSEEDSSTLIEKTMQTAAFNEYKTRMLTE